MVEVETMFRDGDNVVLTIAGKMFLSDFSSDIRNATEEGRDVFGIVKGDVNFSICFVQFNFDGDVVELCVHADRDIELVFAEDNFQAEDMSYILC